MMRRTSAFVLAGVLACACGQQDMGSIDSTIGVVDADGVFEPVTAGDPLDIVIGFQGGIMLAPALRASNVNPGDPSAQPDDPGNPLVTWRLLVDGSETGSLIMQLPMIAAPDEAGAFDLGTAYIQVLGWTADRASEFAGVATEVVVEVDDCDGRHGEATVVVTPVTSS
jgi:hypothetical protein